MDSLCSRQDLTAFLIMQHNSIFKTLKLTIPPPPIFVAQYFQIQNDPIYLNNQLITLL